MLEVEIFPLVNGLALPQPAPATTRSKVPAGYGIQEHCAPFAAASSLGFLIPSPITFGLCPPEEIPQAGRPFRSPLDLATYDGSYADRRVFYVVDDPESHYIGNAFVVQTSTELSSPAWYEAGISFFHRQDQLDLFKLHLPYVWRTPSGIDTVFVPPINRDTGGPILLCGVVETDWYANPVNLVFRKPAWSRALHVQKGYPLAQAIFVPRVMRRAEVKVVGPTDRRAVQFLSDLQQWREDKQRRRNAYKRLSHKHRSARTSLP